MTLPSPPEPPYAPTTELVAIGWLRLAVPYVDVDETLPKPDDTMRSTGFLQTTTVGGRRDVDVPLFRPVTRVSCWVAPAEDGDTDVPINAARRLARWVMDATDDRALMNRVVPLTAFGEYRPARVHTVLAVGIPRRVEDPARFGRMDVDLQINWTGA